MPIASSPIRYLLDTNLCIYVINARPPAVLARFMAHEIDGLGISAITASELYWCVCKSGSSRNKTTLEKQGTPIGPLDQQIAAHALALDITLVTNNVREFERVPDLRVENWV